jgi:hypothetical protein
MTTTTAPILEDVRRGDPLALAAWADLLTDQGDLALSTLVRLLGFLPKLIPPSAMDPTTSPHIHPYDCDWRHPPLGLYLDDKAQHQLQVGYSLWEGQCGLAGTTGRWVSRDILPEWDRVHPAVQYVAHRWERPLVMLFLTFGPYQFNPLVEVDVRKEDLQPISVYRREIQQGIRCNHFTDRRARREGKFDLPVVQMMYITLETEKGRRQRRRQWRESRRQQAGV